MKSSFTGHKRESHRRRKSEKDSFVKEGGLGSELEGLKYKPVYQDAGQDKIYEAQEDVEVEEYDEIQIEDINMNEYAAIQGSFLGNSNVYGNSFTGQSQGQYHEPVLVSTEEIGVQASEALAN